VIQERSGELTVKNEGEIATIFASDYLNKFSAEKIERECRQQLAAGCKTLVVNFRDTEIVNSVGISILVGVINAAADTEAKIIFSEVNEHTIQLFEVLGLTKHVEITV
jgi:anti-anti-sigma factor